MTAYLKWQIRNMFFIQQNLVQVVRSFSPFACTFVYIFHLMVGARRLDASLTPLRTRDCVSSTFFCLRSSIIPRFCLDASPPRSELVLPPDLKAASDKAASDTGQTLVPMIHPSGSSGKKHPGSQGKVRHHM